MAQIVVLTEEEKMEIKANYMKYQEDIIDSMLRGDMKTAISIYPKITDVLPPELIYQLTKSVDVDDEVAFENYYSDAKKKVMEVAEEMEDDDEP